MVPFYLAVCRSRLGRHIVSIHWDHSAVMRSASKTVSIADTLGQCLPLMNLVLEGHPCWPLGVGRPQMGLPYRVIAFEDPISRGGSITRILASSTFSPLE